MSDSQNDDTDIGRENVQTELAALADGTLPADRREQALAGVRDSPPRSDALARQRRALALMRSLETVSAPSSLRESIEELTRESPRRSPARRRIPRLARLRTSAAIALAACAATAAVIALSAGAPRPPTVLEAARLALAPATLASPVENPRAPGLLESSVEGVTYPYWGGRRGWPTAGARSDRLGGRAVRTVFYSSREGARVGYAIVAGRALPSPRGGASVERGGTRFQVLHAGDASIVAWREGGHTCILTARGVPARVLLALVS